MTEPPLTALSVIRVGRTIYEAPHHAIERAYPTGRFRTACGRVFYGWTAPRDEAPITCTICLRKGA